MAFVKPNVVASKCLGFAHCRYNGLMISNDFVDVLRSHIKFSPVCPEIEIGLGVPRNPIRIVSSKDSLKLIQSTTETDVTDKMNTFSQSFLTSLSDIDGFILKNKSPSCGIKNVRIYPRIGKVASISKGSGFFGGTVLKKFPYSAVEDEGRLRHPKIREHFLTKLFTLARFRQVKTLHSIKELIRFHSENKLLFMAYNQTALKVLGRIVANRKEKQFHDLLREYANNFQTIFSHVSRYTSNINVLLHALGYFKKGLSHDEKTFFLDSLQNYRDGRIPLCVVTNIVKSWIIRFDEKYLKYQTFFSPYPEELVECFLISSKNKDRNFRKWGN